MKRYLLLLVIVCCVSHTLCGQTEDTKSKKKRKKNQERIAMAILKHRFSFKAGLFNERLVDETFSGILFQGVLPKYTLGYKHKKLRIELQSSTPNLDKTNIDFDNTFFPSTLLDAHLKIGLSKTFELDFTYGAKLNLGGQLHSQLMVLNYDNFDSGSWLTAQRLDVTARLEKHLRTRKEQWVHLDVSYPLFALASRPAYAGIDNFLVENSDDILKILYSRNDFYSGIGLVNPELTLTYFYKPVNYHDYTTFAEKLMLHLSLHYEYLYINSVKPLSRNSFGIELGLTYLWFK